MAFQQLRFAIAKEESDAVSDALETLGALSITFLDAKDQPIYEPESYTTPAWDNVIVTALFPAEKFSLEILEDKAWERECMDQFKPIQFGEKLWICPSWHEVSDSKAIIVKLDPGLAFGTGSHPTTRLCLNWLATNDIQHKTVIDYGCGSGILAIAAAKLGAKKVIALDIDSQALEATRSNAEHNACVIEALMPDQLSDTRVDIIIANILANPLIDLMPVFAAHLKDNGKLILSGILEEQVDDIIKAYAEFQLTSLLVEEGWARLVYCSSYDKR